MPLLAGLPLVDLIAFVGNVIIPPAFDFLKKKFVKTENDTPERTVSTLAATKPEVLGAYVESLSKLYAAKTEWFNRDIVKGSPVANWVVSLRAAIRPFSVIGAFIILGASYFGNAPLPVDIKIACESVIGNWVGSRMVIE